MFISRRALLLSSAAAVLPFTAKAVAEQDGNSSKHKFCVFTKPFNSLSYDQLASEIASLGFAGIEAPIRPGGHIEPESVPDELPKLSAALKKHNLEITVMTSNINDPTDPQTEKILKTAAKLGIARYRMRYFHYDFDKPITNQIKNWNGQLRDLAALNKDLGISAVYQNHAGAKYLGASLWDLDQALAGIDPQQIGVAYDIRHATVDGGTSWPATFRMIRPRITTVYVKDFRWVDNQARNVPLGKGQVSPAFFKLLEKTKYNGPISLHEEYLDHRDPKLVPKHLAAIKHDFATLQSWL